MAHEAVSGSPVEAGGFKGLGTRRGEFCDADAVLTGRCYTNSWILQSD